MLSFKINLYVIFSWEEQGPVGPYLTPTEMGVKLVLAVASALPQADQPFLQCAARPSPST